MLLAFTSRPNDAHFVSHDQTNVRFELKHDSYMHRRSIYHYNQKNRKFHTLHVGICNRAKYFFKRHDGIRLLRHFEQSKFRTEHHNTSRNTRIVCYKQNCSLHVCSISAVFFRATSFLIPTQKNGNSFMETCKWKWKFHGNGNGNM